MHSQLEFVVVDYRPRWLKLVDPQLSDLKQIEQQHSERNRRRVKLERVRDCLFAAIVRQNIRINNVDGTN